MYRLKLCFRYVMSRALSVVATVGVLLGVGTLIVVMAVMSGFVRDLRDSIRGGLSDVIIETDVTGVAHYDEFITRIKQHENVAEATPVVQLYGLVQIRTKGYGLVSRPCLIFGVRPDEVKRVSRFKQYLERQSVSAAAPTFDMPEADAQRLKAGKEKAHPGCIPGIELVTYTERSRGKDDEAEHADVEGDESDVNRPKSTALAVTGTKIVLNTLPIGTGRIKGDVGGTVRPSMRPYRVVDKYESGLYEADSKFVFISLEEAQLLGELGDPSGDNPDSLPRVHQIRVSLKDYDKAEATIADLEQVWKDLKKWELLKASSEGRMPVLSGKLMAFNTWEQQRRAVLGAYDMQYVLIIIILGLIVVVAAFLIGAVLAMIVKEKTRDIGILKCLGATNLGVAQIFLYYATLVSGVGSLLGLLSGKLFVHHIDAIEAFVSRQLGINVFSREAYYFSRIPRHQDPWQQAIVVAGAIGCAILCSTVAAYRAARLQPVEALRYE